MKSVIKSQSYSEQFVLYSHEMQPFFHILLLVISLFLLFLPHQYGCSRLVVPDYVML